MSQETLFHEALVIPPDQRAAYLDAACAGQSQLRANVEALLVAHAEPGNPLDQPLPGIRQHVEPEPGPDPFAITTHYQPPFEQGLIIAGRYSLVEMIGEGGMAEVWVAQQTEPVKRKVALKVIKAGMNRNAVLTRFEQERQALALMNHPNIARVLDGGLTPDSRPFFVMDLVNGLPLNRYCDQARLPVRQRLELFVPICQAVQHAHQKGIIHRDLKPANILVTTIDGKPVPKVIDFGLAKATTDRLIDESLSTQFGTILGTLEYMAPEQTGYSGADIDTRADIYSLGVILYELLSGLRPFDSERLRQAAWPEMIRILREEEPSWLSKRLSTEELLPSLAVLRQTEPRKLMALLRGELDWIVMKCLEKQRDRRYETADGLARDIQRYLADEPVEARQPNTRYRLGKFLRRNKAPVLAVGLVLLTLIGGLVGTTVGMVQAEKARGREEEQRDKAEQADAKRLKAEEEQDRQRQKLEAFFPPGMREGLGRLPLDLPDVPPASYSNTEQYRVSLGLTYYSHGRLFFVTNETRESLAWFDKAIETLSAVDQQYLPNRETKFYLRRSLVMRAQAYDMLQRYREASTDLSRAIEFGLESDQYGDRLARSWSLVQDGQVTKGLAEAEDLMKYPNWTAKQLYVFPCIYAIASGKSSDKKQEYGNRAMKLLHKAVKAGYTNVAHMMEDHDLDSIREREDFKQLIRGLKKKSADRQEKQP